jgi:hypothetical protein
MKNSLHTLSIGYREKYVEGSVNTKFLSLQIDNHLNWKNHTDQLVPKLSGACHSVGLCHIPAMLTLSDQFILPIFTL